MTLRHSTCLFLFLFSACAAVTTEPVEVAGQGLLLQLSDGPVEGELDGTTRSFIGIPYAAPPLGALRWQPPQHVKSWTAPLAAQGPGVACIQPNAEKLGAIEQSEDCLYLNVFTPAELPEEPLPVMVWLHGGGNITGSANQLFSAAPLLGVRPPARRLYDGAALRDYAERDVIVVTLNYRLGPLGFLSHPGLSAEAKASGNYGLMDQQAALRWVQNEIAAFGGDPTRVTLVGQDAGASDACYHLVAPSSSGLFQAAILQNGSCGSFPEPDLHESEQRGSALAAVLGCEAGEPAASIECLRQQPAAAFAVAPDSKAALVLEVTPLVTIDGQFLTESAESALDAGRFAQVPLIIGNDDRLAVTHTDPFGSRILDALFVCPARELALRTSQRVPVFMYSFTRSAAFDPSVESYVGITRGGEQLWTWNVLASISPYTADDTSLSLKMRGYWSLLVDGDVNAERPRWERPHWPHFGREREAELILDLNISGAEQHRTERCD